MRIPYVQFETNTRCNAKCTFCPHSQMEKRPEMPLDMILKIVSETCQHTDAYLPFLYQEPALEPRLIPILHIIKTKAPHAKTAIYSNMGAMTPALSRDIVESGHLDNLFISFYGPTEELYNKYQPGLNWNKTQENIRNFSEISKGRVHTTMWYIEIPELVPHYQSYKEYWSNFVDCVGLVSYENFCGTFPDLVHYTNVSRKPCTRPEMGMNILCDGKVVPCCLDYNGTVVLGNAFEENIMDIWTGEKMQEFRAMHRDGDFKNFPKLCLDCDVWRRT